MPKRKIPVRWDLGDTPRYKRQNMERAMRRDMRRGLVELITNCDDSYRDLEEQGKQASGKIRIEIERRRKGQPSKVIVRDRAGGMTREQMHHNLGTLGRRTSGFEKGKARRGLHGRGARDVAAFGAVHFESIKNGEYNHLTISPALVCEFKESRPTKATRGIRERLGIPKGNGTVVTIEVDGHIPQHDTLAEDFSQWYCLRDIFSSRDREVTIVDLNKGRESRLRYRSPEGQTVFDDGLTLPEYPGIVAHLRVCRHGSPFEASRFPHRQGILVKSAAAIHDCTYFGLESEAFSWRFSGELRCEYIDDLVREYDNREETHPDDPKHPAGNPSRLLDPFRDGLMPEHPFRRALYTRCKGILRPLVLELKASEEPERRDVADRDLARRLKGLSKEISRVFEDKLRELDEEIVTVNVADPRIKQLAVGLHIIPPEEQPIVVNQPKTFSIVVKDYEAVDGSLPVDVSSSNPRRVRVARSPVFLTRSLEDPAVGRTTFTVEGFEVGAEEMVEVYYGGYDNLVLVRVVEPPPPPEVPDGLSFDRPLYRLRVNKGKDMVLRLKGGVELNAAVTAEILSDHPEVVVMGGGRRKLRPTDTRGLLRGRVRIEGRQLKARAKITARLEGFEPATAYVVVVERLPLSGVRLEFKPVEEDFGATRYKWEDPDSPSLLFIGAKHPSIRRYLGEPIGQKYPGIDSALYRTVLAEVIAEALAFNILGKQFRREGLEGMLDYDSTDLYYHKHFSEFLLIAHRNLVHLRE